MIEITEINDGRISHFHGLKSLKDKHTAAGLFVAEGIKTCRQLLKSSLDIKSIFAFEEYYSEFDELIKQRLIPENMKFTASKDIMNQVVGFRIHSGIMILAQEPLPTPLEEVGGRLVVLNGIIDSENVGSIVRNCAAFGFDSVIADKATSSPYLRRAVRVSLGTVFFTKIHYSKDLNDTLLILKKMGYTIIGAEIAENSLPIDNFEFPPKYAIIFGTESKGISSEVLALCDILVYIPVNPLVSSINVAASSAIILREAGNGNI